MSDQETALMDFARKIIADYCWGSYSDPDGGDVQDLAERLGIIVPTIATEEDATADIEPGDKIYKFAEWMKPT
jgi:hypothetical protein